MLVRTKWHLGGRRAKHGSARWVDRRALGITTRARVTTSRTRAFQCYSQRSVRPSYAHLAHQSGTLRVRSGLTRQLARRHHLSRIKRSVSAPTRHLVLVAFQARTMTMISSCGSSAHQAMLVGGVRSIMVTLTSRVDATLCFMPDSSTTHKWLLSISLAERHTYAVAGEGDSLSHSPNSTSTLT